MTDDPETAANGSASPAATERDSPAGATNRKTDLAAEVAVIIPALNEEESIGGVIRELPRPWPMQIIVADNGSTDGTARVSRQAAAEVVSQPERGYGAACLAALARLRETVKVVAFLDGDGSDAAGRLPDLVDPVLQGRYDLVIGSRTLGDAEPGALTPTQRFGNRLACTMMQVLHGRRYTDLGPFRAIDRQRLEQMRMTDRTWGWTVEMQVKAARSGLRVLEVPVPYRRRRLGRSKISGTIRGSAAAGCKIIITILRYA